MVEIARYTEFTENQKQTMEFSVAGFPFELVNPSLEQQRYVRDTFFPAMQEAEGGVEKLAGMEGVEAVLERDTILQFVEKLSNVTFEKGYYFGEVAPEISFVTIPEYGFINFTFSKAGETFHRFVGTGTKFAISSYTKAHVFWGSYKDDPNFMVSHSSSIKDLASNTGIVLSTSDRGDVNNRAFGKTTTALALLTRGQGRYAFASNDEIIWSRKKGVAVPLPLPNELSIMGSGLNSIFKGNRPELIDWREKDKIRDDTRYYTTHASLFRANYPVGSFKRVSVWAFIDLKLNEEGCQVENVEGDEAFRHFNNVVFDDRMALAASPLKFLGEAAAYIGNPSVPEVDTRPYFDLLTESGVKFIKISGSVNPDVLHSKISKII